MPDARLEAASFAELYRVEYRRVVAALVMAGATPTDAEDAAQDAFARTFAHWRRVRHGPSPAGYVFRAAFRRHARNLPRSEPHDPAEDAVFGALADPAPGPEAMATGRVAVDALLAAMPPRRRACAVLCLVVGLDTEETAETLGMSPSTVRVHLHHARLAAASSARPDHTELAEPAVR